MPSNSKRQTDSISELINGNTPTVILAVLEQKEALHGYGIGRQFERRRADLLKLGEGSLYPALRALAAEGLVDSNWEPQTDGPARTAYSLADAGRTGLVQRIDSWRRFADAFNGIPDSESPPLLQSV